MIDRLIIRQIFEYPSFVINCQQSLWSHNKYAKTVAVKKRSFSYIWQLGLYVIFIQYNFVNYRVIRGLGNLHLLYSWIQRMPQNSKINITGTYILYIRIIKLHF